ncbi:MAG: hypothetical protein LBC37_02430, partial [Zoogloeaceae bacterium]|nr:hypothetical protein [Zoogloeaceae bacterium]
MMQERECRNDRPSGVAWRLVVRFFSAFFLAMACLSATAAPVENNALPANFREIPGITAEEIQAIEKVLAKRKTFIYGVMEGSECFYRDDGSLDGYTVMMIAAIRELFGFSVEIKTYEWNAL